MAGGASESDDEINGINVTPLVDVCLVLLIIFMVTANMISNHGMNMDLPQASNAPTVQLQFAVELGADGSTQADSRKLPNDEALAPVAKAAKQKNKDLRAVIRADQRVMHGRVIKVLDILRSAGISKIAFAVSPASEPAPVERK